VGSFALDRFRGETDRHADLAGHTSPTEKTSLFFDSNHSGCGWGPGVSGDGIAESGEDGDTVFAHGGDVAADP